ncbi:MAG: germination protein YpeB [Oscillospiraceae bacterium]|nr:germination protein YpeB [Oscillospiraceae bacterium]
MRTNTKTMSRRGLIRLISLLTAGLVAFAVMTGVYAWRNTQATRHIEYSYQRSLENLAMSVESIKTTLNKGMYSNSSQMLGDLSGRLSGDASGAKMSLSQLPVNELNLENTNTFLSQVGNYSNSLARKFARGEELTEEDRENIASLLEYAENLSNELWEIENLVSSGHFIFKDPYTDGDSETYHIRDGFADVEGLFENYKSLTYDGPFSEHIMTGEPRLIENEPFVLPERILTDACRVSACETMEHTGQTEGRIPKYVFRGDNATVTFTRNGGVFASMIKNRQVGEKDISMERAIELAENYLDDIGVANMTHTYYSHNGGVCIINFASEHVLDIARPNDTEITGDIVQERVPVVVYPDLIKVGVALDNGEIVSFDATPYITAHHEREMTQPTRSEAEARSGLSPLLAVQNVRLAVIPSSGNNEVLCYEFLCQSSRGNQVLVYVNANTGAEEQISLVRISESGTLVV